MTDDEIIRMMREHFEGFFPKVCSKCGRCFATLREYILDTERTGLTLSYDAELRDWQPSKPLGAIAAADCICGTTLVLTTIGMSLSSIHLVLEWIRVETQRRGLSPEELIGYVRDEIRKQVLSDPVQEVREEKDD